MYQQTIPWKPNYDERKIPPYSLPPLMTCLDGTPVRTQQDWREKRRPELLALFRQWLYGDFAPLPDETRCTVVSEKKDARGGSAIRREIRMEFRMKNEKSHSVVMLLYFPVSASETNKVPVFAGLAFGGNQVATVEPDIMHTGFQGRNDDPFFAPGAQARRYPVGDILKRGYGLALASYDDFFPDSPDKWDQSIYRLFYPEEKLKTRLKGHSAIGAWAWGLSRMADALENVPEIDASKMACYGQSRLGKASLWAGANDERFKLVCVNCSGCGGAALNRRLYGETLYSMFVHSGLGRYWFNDPLEAVAETPSLLPVEQHELIALAAPRRIAVHSATLDQWADPKSEFLSAFYAGPAFRLFGKEPLPDSTPPPPDTAVGSDISYYLRTGAHDLLPADWSHYMNMADGVFRKQVK